VITPAEHPAAGLLSDLVMREDGAINLPAAALCIARVGDPGLDPAPHLQRLDALAEQAYQRVSCAPRAERVSVLGDVFSQELGFHGNSEHYYDPRNSFLNEVITRRTGIPITLSIVYMRLAEEVGVEVEGVGMPGHFLVRELDQGRIIDPYAGARVLTQRDCRRLLEGQGVPRSSWRDDFLRGVTKTEILARLINNLYRYYATAGDTRRQDLLVGMVRVIESARDSGTHARVH